MLSTVGENHTTTYIAATIFVVTCGQYWSLNHFIISESTRRIYIHSYFRFSPLFSNLFDTSPNLPAVSADNLPFFLSHTHTYKHTEPQNLQNYLCLMCLVTQSCLTLCNPIEPARLLCPWDFSGKSTRVGSHFLLQGLLQTQESNLNLLHCRRTLYCLSHQGSYLYPSIIFSVTKEVESLLFIIKPFTSSLVPNYSMVFRCFSTSEYPTRLLLLLLFFNFSYALLDLFHLHWYMLKT